MKLAGDWTGTNSLWLTPGEPARVCETTASISLAAQGKFFIMHYTWSVEGEPADGCLLLGQEEPGEAVTAVWIDSWHNGDKLMLCRGSASPDGSISVKGTYSAPPAPDWGWRIVLQPGAGDSFEMLMYNITPEGQEQLAVRAAYPGGA
jgi:hypothetical protein